MPLESKKERCLYVNDSTNLYVCHEKFDQPWENPPWNLCWFRKKVPKKKHHVGKHSMSKVFKWCARWEYGMIIKYICTINMQGDCNDLAQSKSSLGISWASLSTSEFMVLRYADKDNFQLFKKVAHPLRESRKGLHRFVTKKFVKHVHHVHCVQLEMQRVGVHQLHHLPKWWWERTFHGAEYQLRDTKDHQKMRDAWSETVHCISIKLSGAAAGLLYTPGLHRRNTALSLFRSALFTDAKFGKKLYHFNSKERLVAWKLSTECNAPRITTNGATPPEAKCTSGTFQTRQRKREKKDTALSNANCWTGR